jgi:hypothetical protein
VPSSPIFAVTPLTNIFLRTSLFVLIASILWLFQSNVSVFTNVLNRGSPLSLPPNRTAVELFLAQLDVLPFSS